MIKIGEKKLKLNDFENVVYDKANVSLDKEALEKVNTCYDFLKEFAANKVIYGINTGFGPMAQYKIEDHKRIKLQYNLIRSHCTGMGNKLSYLQVRAAMLCQLNTMMLGKSGVNQDVPKLVCELLNKQITPVVYEHGGVGASGDLVQLAHLALTYIGEGESVYDKKEDSTINVFSKHDVKPLEIKLREGLSLMNGTSVMTGIGILNTSRAKNLLNWTLIASALMNEIVNAYDDHFSAQLNYAKQHKGQQIIADTFRSILKDSQLIESRQENLYNKKVEETYIEKKVQEYYSLRCTPQIIGPIYDTLTNTINTLENEINSVNDNPIIDIETKNVYHGGNFHGDYVSLAMDQLRLAITKLSMLSERQLNFLMNHKINDKLPPFANLGELGFNFGVQGAQFTATSTTAENQMLSSSMYVHSIPNNNDNQDIVSMGTNASSATNKVIDNAYQVLSIEFVAIIQAIEYLKIEHKLSSITKRHFKDIKEICPPFKDDSVLYKKTNNIKKYLENTRIDLITTPLSKYINNTNGKKLNQQ